jgi:hypothetical protein
MAIKRREFIGGATETSLSSGINSTATTISVADGSGFPTGGDFPFVIVVDRGESDEEKVLIASRSSNTLTVATNYGGVTSGRAFDDTSGAAHDSGSKVAHVLDATTMTDLSQSSYDTEVLYWMGGT